MNLWDRKSFSRHLQSLGSSLKLRCDAVLFTYDKRWMPTVKFRGEGKFYMRTIYLIFVILLQGCASSEIRPLRPNELAVAPYHEAGSKSLVGSLMYEGNCLLFEDEDRSVRLLPIWPTGSRFEESLVTFHRPGKADQRVPVGEEIRLDGESADWAELASAGLASFQHQCGGEPFFVTAITPAN
jgi:hypothetical protein